ncbi:hypothetical protein Tco_1323779, partial [Tanacetum coccineum]
TTDEWEESLDIDDSDLRPTLNAAKATSVGEFNKKMAELKSYNSDAYDWLMKIPTEQWSRAYFSEPNVFYYKQYMKWELTGIPCKHVVAAIYNMSENSVGVVKYATVIIPSLYKPQVDRLPKKRKKSHDEIASESCSLGKLSRKGKSIKCGKCGNVGHNRKGCMGQSGASQAGGSSARNVSGQAGARQDAGARNVSGQAAGARNASSQSGDSSQPSATPSTASQGPTQHSAGPRQGFQAPRPAPTQRLTKKIASRHSPRKLSS